MNDTYFMAKKGQKKNGNDNHLYNLINYFQVSVEL